MPDALYLTMSEECQDVRREYRCKYTTASARIRMMYVRLTHVNLLCQKNVRTYVQNICASTPGRRAEL